ncbi:hypothetical protein SAMN06272735_3604 [Streptomyces sp. TLI_55]|nr:hypothetical protein SAMN06272735_3604 [Streptomyces sp. TLI_55]
MTKRSARTGVRAPEAHDSASASTALTAPDLDRSASSTPPALPSGPAMKRRGSPLLVAACGKRGHLSRPAARRGRGFPGLAPTTPEFAPELTAEFTFELTPKTPHCTPVPAPAHSTPRAIRVRRSPR